VSCENDDDYSMSNSIAEFHLPRLYSSSSELEIHVPTRELYKGIHHIYIPYIAKYQSELLKNIFTAFLLYRLFYV
jgi:hypothetical protein